MAFGVWFVMLSSKFVFIWAIDIVFGDDVKPTVFVLFRCDRGAPTRGLGVHIADDPVIRR